MKSSIAWNCGLGLALALLPLASGCVQEASSSPEQTAPASPPVSATNSAPLPAPDQPAIAADVAPEDDSVDAAATPISSPQALPANVKPSGPVSEVIRLAQSGVDESVMLAFVTNSPSTFNVRADEIIFLNDLGVPGSVVTAMIERDEQLKQLTVSAAVSGPEAHVPAPPADQAAPPPGAAPYDAAGPTPTEPPPTNYGADYYPPPSADAAYTNFYDALSPYGSWVDVGGYGPCWQPTVVVINAGWQPYFNCGRWIYTDCGWYWMSDYSWGWAPFHYGRWFHHHHLGWCWCPGHVWGPSWVSWRYTDNHCGWAPLPPSARFTAGVGLTFQGHAAGATTTFGLTAQDYRFIQWRHFRDHHLDHFALSHDEAARTWSRSVVAAGVTSNHNTPVNNAIPLQRVAAATHAPVPRVALHDVNTAAFNGVHADRLDPNGRTLAVYRPQLPQSPLAQRSVPQRPQPAAPGAAAPATALSSPNRFQRSVPAPANALASQQAGAQSRQGIYLSGQSPMPDSPDRLPDTTPRPGKVPPLILHGPDRSSRSMTAQGADPGQKPQQFSSTAQPAQTQVPWAPGRYGYPAQSSGRYERPQTAPRAEAPRPWAASDPRFGGSATAMATPNVPQDGVTPNYRTWSRQAPAEVPRYAPAPAYGPSPGFSAPGYQAPIRSAPAEASRNAPSAGGERSRSYSAPERPQQSEAPQPRATYSAPAAPAPAAPAPAAPSSASTYSRSGGDRR